MTKFIERILRVLQECWRRFFASVGKRLDKTTVLGMLVGDGIGGVLLYLFGLGGLFCFIIGFCAGLLGVLLFGRKPTA